MRRPVAKCLAWWHAAAEGGAKEGQRHLLPNFFCQRASKSSSRLTHAPGLNGTPLTSSGAAGGVSGVAMASRSARRASLLRDDLRRRSSGLLQGRGFQKSALAVEGGSRTTFAASAAGEVWSTHVGRKAALRSPQPTWQGPGLGECKLLRPHARVSVGSEGTGANCSECFIDPASNRQGAACARTIMTDRRKSRAPDLPSYPRPPNASSRAVRRATPRYVRPMLCAERGEPGELSGVHFNRSGNDVHQSARDGCGGTGVKRLLWHVQTAVQSLVTPTF